MGFSQVVAARPIKALRDIFIRRASRVSARASVFVKRAVIGTGLARAMLSPGCGVPDNLGLEAEPVKPEHCPGSGVDRRGAGL